MDTLYFLYRWFYTRLVPAWTVQEATSLLLSLSKRLHARHVDGDSKSK